ncbi:MAG: energy transducer TonB [Nevskiales bacterium]|nr:energy transducer TonB [Nevskiales bacterium]
MSVGVQTVHRFGASRQANGWVLGAIVGLHVAVLWALMQMGTVREAMSGLAPIMVRLIHAPATPAVPLREQPVPKPQMIAAARPEGPPAMEAPPVEEPPLPVTPPSFSAAYLDNPLPVYPAASKRLGEAGRVLLRVWVDAQGRAERVEVERSSGFPRLDVSAREAVGRWRFVPARQGPAAVAGVVRVPVVFELKGVER